MMRCISAACSASGKLFIHLLSALSTDLIEGRNCYLFVVVKTLFPSHTEHIFLYLLAIHLSSLENMFLCMLCPVFNCVLLWLSYKHPLYSGYHTLGRFINCTYFLPFCGLSFHFLSSILCSQKSFNFHEAQLVSPILLLLLLVSYLRNHSLTLDHK